METNINFNNLEPQNLKNLGDINQKSNNQINTDSKSIKNEIKTKKQIKEEKINLKRQQREKNKEEKLLAKSKKNISDTDNFNKMDAELEELKKNVEKAKSREKRLTFTEGSYELDNAALIYPPSRTGAWNAAYRVSALLKKEVDAENLQNALDATIDRFPYYNVVLKRGVFWYYFQVLSTKPKIEKEENYPCSVFDFRGDKPIFRILYYKNKISLESFHSLGDGYGAVLFLNAILMNYFSFCGEEIDFKKYFINPNDLVDAEETEDAFLKYADLVDKTPRKENKAWQVKGTRLEYGQTRIINGIIPTDALKLKAKEFNCSLNEFMLSSLIYSLLQAKKQAKNKKHKVKVSLPIDCRRFFPSKTMRNFSSYKNFELENEELDFNGIINFVQDGMKEIDKDYLMRNINANVYPQKNVFVRMMPLQVKNLVLRFCFNTFGEKLFTTSFSNIGLIKAPIEFSNLIERYEAMIGGGKMNGVNVATCSYNNQTVITFSRRIKETLVEKIFFRHLSNVGLDVIIETN